MIDLMLVYILVVQDLVHNSSKCDAWVELDPRWRKHEVNMAFVFVRPELDDPSEIELADNLMRFNQCIHVGLEAVLSVDTLLVEFDLNKAVRVGSNDEVNFSPINHDNFLHVIHNIWQLLWSKAFKTLLGLRWSEITAKNFVFMEPFRS